MNLAAGVSTATPCHQAQPVKQDYGDSMCNSAAHGNVSNKGVDAQACLDRWLVCVAKPILAMYKVCKQGFCKTLQRCCCSLSNGNLQTRTFGMVTACLT